MNFRVVTMFSHHDPDIKIFSSWIESKSSLSTSCSSLGVILIPALFHPTKAQAGNNKSVSRGTKRIIHRVLLKPGIREQVGFNRVYRTRKFKKNLEHPKIQRAEQKAWHSFDGVQVWGKITTHLGHVWMRKYGWKRIHLKQE